MKKFLISALALAGLMSVSNAVSAQTYSVLPKASSGTVGGTLYIKQTLPESSCTVNSIPYAVGNAASSNVATTSAAIGSSLCTTFPGSLVKLKANWTIAATGPSSVLIGPIWLDTLAGGECGSSSTYITGTVVAGPPQAINIPLQTIPGTPATCTVRGTVTPSGGISIGTP